MTTDNVFEVKEWVRRNFPNGDDALVAAGDLRKVDGVTVLPDLDTRVHRTHDAYGVDRSMMAPNETTTVDPTTGGMKGVKPERYDLLPWGFATDEVARVYAFGAEKYEDHNWRRGYAWSKSIAAMFRHIIAFARGQDHDPDSGLHHLAHAVFHCLALMTWHDEDGGTDDRYLAGVRRTGALVDEATKNGQAFDANRLAS